MNLTDILFRKATPTRLYRGAACALASAAAFSFATTALATDADRDGTPDSADAFPCDPTADAVAYAPAEGQHGMLMFEDLWPQNGDLDFNDATITYNYEFLIGDGLGGKKKAAKKGVNGDVTSNVSAIHATFNVLAKGAAFSNGFALHLPVPRDSVSSITLNFEDGAIQSLSPAEDETDLVIPIVADIGSLFSGVFVNTTSDVPSAHGKPVNVLIRFNDSQSIDLGTAPFDVFLVRTGERGHQIHLPQYPGTDTMDTTLFGQGNDGSTADRHFVNTQGLPFALDVPSAVLWPKEWKSIDSVYPDIALFASSGGTDHTDYYLTNLQTDNLWTGGAGGSPPPVPVSIGPGFPTADKSCVPSWNGTVQFGTTAYDWPFDNVLDSAGNIAVVGYTSGDMGGDPANVYGEAAFVQKFDPSGTALWAHLVNIPNTYYGYAQHVGADASGNVYVTGTVYAADTNYQDAFVARYGSDGHQDWVQRIGADGSEQGNGVSVVGDAVYVSGYTSGSTWLGGSDTNQQIFLAKFDLSGTPQFVKGYATDGSTGTYYGYPQDMTADSDGNLVIAGQSYVPAVGNYRGMTWKIDPAGLLLWTNFSSQSGADTLPGGAYLSYDQNGYQAIAADGNGATLAAGYQYTYAYYNPVTYNYCYYDYYYGYYCYDYTSYSYYYSQAPIATKLDSSGAAVWNHRFASLGYNSSSSSAYSYGYPQGAETDPAGNLLVTGYASGVTPGNQETYFVSKLDGSSGNEAWLKFGSDQNSPESGAGVCVDSSGASYVAGSVYGSIDGQSSVGSWDGFLVKYDADGNKL